MYTSLCILLHRMQWHTSFKLYQELRLLGLILRTSGLFHCHVFHTGFDSAKIWILSTVLEVGLWHFQTPWVVNVMWILFVIVLRSCIMNRHAVVNATTLWSVNYFDRRSVLKRICRSYNLTFSPFVYKLTKHQLILPIILIVELIMDVFILWHVKFN